MEEFKRSRLWTRALDNEYLSSTVNENERVAVARLQTSFLNLRHRASTLAGEISRDVPTLTVHDISHIDALWETADTIIGDELLSAKEPYLNPLEAYVLGSAFLIHDLVQSRAALDISDEELRSDERFADILNSLSDGSDDDADTWTDALGIYLRENHAELSQSILTRAWKDIDDRDQYLLVDSELRESLARPIGQIASSHGLPVRSIQSTFNVKLGAPVFLPQNWSCDMTKLAALIRLADASHIDARRAPAFLSALRTLKGIARRHWSFQQKLYRVRREGDRLVYTSGSPFNFKEIEAWWLCFDTLQMIDKELKEVDALLADTRMPRYAARSVAGIDDPKRLAEFIPTEGWVPVDTQIRVGNVAALVTRLGGGQLYGENMSAPLRELIQNAADAVLARRLLEDRPADWGEVTVELIEVEDHWILRVGDSGIGMSAGVMTGALLDFGTSFWNSSEARKEFPGLRRKSFKSTGCFGIGFFSCFMLGSHVKVTSRRYDLASTDTRVLEFRDGPRSRPILRPASPEECRGDGTKVEIVLTNYPYGKGGVLTYEHTPVKRDLKSFCSWLCPSLPVNLKTKETNGPWLTAIKASDWRTLPPLELLQRVEIEEDDEDQRRDEESRLKTSHFLRPIHDSQGNEIGRLALRLSGGNRYNNFSNGACISVGGCRAESIRSLAGIVYGTPKTAARNSAYPVYEKAEIQRWASEQVELILKTEMSLEERASCAEDLITLEVPLKNLPWIETSRGWLNEEEFTEFCKEMNELFLLSESYIYRSFSRDISLAANIIICGSHSGDSIPDGSGEPRLSFVRPGHQRGIWNRVQWHVITLMAAAWGMTVEELLDSAELPSRTHTVRAVIGNDQYGNPVEEVYLFIFNRVPAANLSSPTKA